MSTVGSLVEVAVRPRRTGSEKAWSRVTRLAEQLTAMGAGAGVGVEVEVGSEVVMRIYLRISWRIAANTKIVLVAK